MFEVSVEAGFSASHRLRLYDGELEPPHGHDWRVTATFRGDALDSIGVLVDFVEAQKQVDEIAAQLHHTDLGDNPLLAGQNPSAEIVAKTIFDALRQSPQLASMLHGVKVTEAPGCAATYIRPDQST